MDAVVVYESLWGNTAAVAGAIAEGLGDGARAMPTDDATPDVVATVDLVVAGAPVHAMSMPTAATREQARTRIQGGPDGLAPDLEHMAMSDWLATLPPGPRSAAAFDTRVRGPFGRGGARAIAARLSDAGYQVVDRPRGFVVHGRTASKDRAALLLPGQLDEARAWGASLRS